MFDKVATEVKCDNLCEGLSHIGPMASLVIVAVINQNSGFEQNLYINIKHILLKLELLDKGVLTSLSCKSDVLSNRNFKILGFASLPAPASTYYIIQSSYMPLGISSELQTLKTL